MSSDKAINFLRGEVGKSVKLTVVRSGVANPIVFNIVREKIESETMSCEMLDNGIAHIKLTIFNNQSAGSIKKTLTNYRKQGMKYLILDLRGNGGGTLDSAVDVASIFIKEKKLVASIKGRIIESKIEYFTSGNGEFSDLPLIILVDERSASASGIVAGMMQYYNRALIVGCNTFGKGCVTIVISLHNGAALELVIAKYYLPSGSSIERSEDKDSKMV
ncbi:hypothetical protein AGMMS49936_11870 [Endomicrobiia bacterium]|nr:hypothetical protein AGMMS49936_11870 [Endomicrobiia bacterium]